MVGSSFSRTVGLKCPEVGLWERGQFEYMNQALRLSRARACQGQKGQVSR